eukprot:m.78245 g.78245  ORF g.78245 m.78245 type:complete len:412 (-) comp8567_c1_seq2:45-1280(-)
MMSNERARKFMSMEELDDAQFLTELQRMHIGRGKQQHKDVGIVDNNLLGGWEKKVHSALHLHNNHNAWIRKNVKYTTDRDESSQNLKPPLSRYAINEKITLFSSMIASNPNREEEYQEKLQKQLKKYQDMLLALDSKTINSHETKGHQEERCAHEGDIVENKHVQEHQPSATSMKIMDNADEVIVEHAQSEFEKQLEYLASLQSGKKDVYTVIKDSDSDIDHGGDDGGRRTAVSPLHDASNNVHQFILSYEEIGGLTNEELENVLVSQLGNIQIGSKLEVMANEIRKHPEEEEAKLARYRKLHDARRRLDNQQRMMSNHPEDYSNDNIDDMIDHVEEARKKYNYPKERTVKIVSMAEGIRLHLKNEHEQELGRQARLARRMQQLQHNEFACAKELSDDEDVKDDDDNADEL